MGLEALFYEGYGYQPLVLTENWQVAQLNYTEEQEPNALTLLDQHDFTDETFTLIEGRALLITYDADKCKGELTPLKLGRTYNVPAMVWHNIAMEEGSKVMITEGRDAHLKGFSQISMPENVRKEILTYVKKNWMKI